MTALPRPVEAAAQVAKNLRIARQQKGAEHEMRLDDYLAKGVCPATTGRLLQGLLRVRTQRHARSVARQSGNVCRTGRAILTGQRDAERTEALADRRTGDDALA